MLPLRLPPSGSSIFGLPSVRAFRSGVATAPRRSGFGAAHNLDRWNGSTGSRLGGHQVGTTIRSLVLFLALMGCVWAQAPTGAIAGVVRDPSRGGVEGARIQAVSVATGLARVAASTEQGDYSFPA